MTLTTYNYLFAIASGRGEQDEVRQVRSRKSRRLRIELNIILLMSTGVNAAEVFLFLRAVLRQPNSTLIRNNDYFVPNFI